MPGTTAASDGPTVSLSFANNFWGKDDAGVIPLLNRMHGAKLTGDELKAFYTARAQIEDEYARKLLSLARKPLGSAEQGTLRMSLDVVRGEVESMAKQHATVAAQMKSELDEPLAAFAGGLKERRKIVQNGVEKLLKTKTQQAGVVNKARDRFEQDCLKIKGYLAQGHMVMGQEERKNKAKLEKTQIQMSTNSNEYEAAVKVLEETTGKWNREWKAACDKFQDLEEERIDFFKSSLWSFANIASTVCVSDDQSCEKIRLSLEDCEVEKDITTFIKDCGTGQEIPDPPKYINFCRGDIDDAASTRSAEDEAYSVAQFQRTINPAFRSSSPQPSTFESHHDPESSLRDDMGIPKARTSIASEEQFNPRGSTGSASGAPPAALQTTQSNLSSTSGDVPRPYGTESMNSFTRLGAPSERSSQPSPTRPGSSGSLQHSDYTNSTAISDLEPPLAQSGRPHNGFNVSSAPSVEEEKPQKKPGFFQSHSPFRRRSQKKLQQQQPASSAINTPAERNASNTQAERNASNTPAKRNTWGPAPHFTTERATNSPSTTSTFATRLTDRWQKQPSPDAEPVDPRADYQLGIGNNVFDVAHPTRPSPVKAESTTGLDPLAQALAELKGVTKQATIRTSADRHYGMGTPAPDARPYASNNDGRTPPPAYMQGSTSLLGAPQPAHTKRDMQKTTERYVNQKREMFTGGHQSEQPRSRSPGPVRSSSPQPYTADTRGHYRSSSPNPYANNNQRSQSMSPQKTQSGHHGYDGRGGSPGYQIPRAASPNPAYNRPQMNGASNARPSSSRGSDGGMALQLAPGQGDAYNQQRSGRPQSSYYGNDFGSQALAARTRSQSQGTQRRMTKDGRPILHYSRAMYMYQAAIPEELSFAKGDILAVLRLQDDGWWEAEIVGKDGRAGLVPSNYLKNC